MGISLVSRILPVNFDSVKILIGREGIALAPDTGRIYNRPRIQPEIKWLVHQDHKCLYTKPTNITLRIPLRGFKDWIFRSWTWDNIPRIFFPQSVTQSLQNSFQRAKRMIAARLLILLEQLVGL